MAIAKPFNQSFAVLAPLAFRLVLDRSGRGQLELRISIQPVKFSEEVMQDHSIPEALTFDDVLLRPAKSSVLPAQVDTQTRFTRNISLKIPVVSAAMDTVTESRLAIALAQQGGIGIIHRTMPIDQQAAEIDKVKRSESGMIVDPVTVRADSLVSEAQEIMRHYKISGVPVTSADGK